MAKPKPKFPVTKNGKFFGYADADQIAAHKSLEVYDQAKAEAIEANKEVEKAVAKKAAEDDAKKAAEDKGADPNAVKKAPSGDK